MFFDEPTKEHYLREISKKSDLAHTSVKNHLEKLLELDIIEEHELQRGERTYPTYIRMDNEKYRFYKRLDMLCRIEESGLREYIDKVFSPDCIVLFGSASRGEDIEESDIDLYLQACKKEIDLSRYEESLNRDIQLHINESLESYPDELMNNIANGIVLTGYLEVIR